MQKDNRMRQQLHLFPGRWVFLGMVLMVLVGGAIFWQWQISCPSYPLERRTHIPSIPSIANETWVDQERLQPLLGVLRLTTKLQFHEVTDFYGSRLRAEGWEDVQQTTDVVAGVATVQAINRQACPYYSLRITTINHRSGTEVVIDPSVSDMCVCD